MWHICFISDKSIIRHGGCWSQQKHIHGTAKEEGASLRDFQDWWEEKWSSCWKDRKTIRELRRFYCFFAWEWLQICSLWLWFCYFWQLSKEQNLFHSMVSFPSLLLFFNHFFFVTTFSTTRWCFSSNVVLCKTRSPSVSRIRAKMLYATSKDRFRRELQGIHYEIQATDSTEMELDVLKERAN